MSDKLKELEQVMRIFDRFSPRAKATTGAIEEQVAASRSRRSLDPAREAQIRADTANVESLTQQRDAMAPVNLETMKAALQGRKLDNALQQEFGHSDRTLRQDTSRRALRSADLQNTITELGLATQLDPVLGLSTAQDIAGRNNIPLRGVDSNFLDQLLETAISENTVPELQPEVVASNPILPAIISYLNRRIGQIQPQ